MNKVLFFTHHKCATKWLGNILSEYSKSIGIEYYHTHYSNKFMPNLDGIHLYTSADYNMIPNEMKRGVHIIRNPIDILVSSYYSHLKSHSLEGWPQLQEMRALLQKLNKKQGLYADLMFLERADFYDGAIAPLKSIRTWNYDDPNFINLRMEDMVDNPFNILSKLFSDLGHDVNNAVLKTIVNKNSFENLSKGRSRGTENDNSHYRNGIPNDGVKHLTLDQIDLVKNLYLNIFERFYTR